MVYLARTARITGDWETVSEAYEQVAKHVKANYAQVGDSYFLMNITGPINEVRWVLEFESLADEEQYALKVVDDSTYLEAMKKTIGHLTSPVDRLYRRIETQ